MTSSTFVAKPGETPVTIAPVKVIDQGNGGTLIFEINAPPLLPGDAAPFRAPQCLSVALPGEPKQVFLGVTDLLGNLLAFCTGAMPSSMTVGSGFFLADGTPQDNPAGFHTADYVPQEAPPAPTPYVPGIDGLAAMIVARPTFINGASFYGMFQGSPAVCANPPLMGKCTNPAFEDVQILAMDTLLPGPAAQLAEWLGATLVALPFRNAGQFTSASIGGVAVPMTVPGFVMPDGLARAGNVAEQCRANQQDATGLAASIRKIFAQGV